jgi:hypothetical protein
MSSPKKIDHNPAAAHVWLREKGAPWRAQHEFLQIQVDEKAKKELDAKYDVRMAKQCAIGIKNMYGLDFDFAMLQFAIKDAKALFNDELPDFLKPRVSGDRRRELREILNAARAFNIPKLVKLFKLKTSRVENSDMASTSRELTFQQTKGLTYTRSSIPKSGREVLKTRQLMSASEENLAKKQRRWKALEQFYNALKYNKKLYRRPSNQWFLEAFDAMDETGAEVMTRQEFTNACFDLGLGVSVKDMQRLCEVLDENEDNRIDYYLVLQMLDLSRPLDPKDPEDRWRKVPMRGGPPKRRTDMRHRGRKSVSTLPQTSTLVANKSSMSLGGDSISTGRKPLTARSQRSQASSRR